MAEDSLAGKVTMDSLLEQNSVQGDLLEHLEEMEEGHQTGMEVEHQVYLVGMELELQPQVVAREVEHQVGMGVEHYVVM